MPVSIIPNIVFFLEVLICNTFVKHVFYTMLNIGFFIGYSKMVTMTLKPKNADRKNLRHSPPLFVFLPYYFILRNEQIERA